MIGKKILISVSQVAIMNRKFIIAVKVWEPVLIMKYLHMYFDCSFWYIYPDVNVTATLRSATHDRVQVQPLRGERFVGVSTTQTDLTVRSAFPCTMISPGPGPPRPVLMNANVSCLSLASVLQYDEIKVKIFMAIIILELVIAGHF
jgi:hypothetical protein